jgi:hypothetical protein
MNASPVLISLVLVFAIFLRSANSADPDPVTDFVTGLSTFTLRDIFKNGDVSNDSGGIRAATSTQNFPAVRYIEYIHVMHILFACIAVAYFVCMACRFWWYVINGVKWFYRTQGLSIVRFKMVPCGSNLPHTHPRASEVLSLLSGGPLQVGFVDTTGNLTVNTFSY